VREKDNESASNNRRLDSPFLETEIAPVRPPGRDRTASTRGLDSPFLQAFSHEEPQLESAALEAYPRRDPPLEAGQAGVERAIDRSDDELLLEYEPDEPETADGLDEAPAGDDESGPPAARAGAIAARILWPALGFPAVISPRPNGPVEAAEADPRRSICR
jgi:hypothetical protein